MVFSPVVLYPKDTEKWKQFTTNAEKSTNWNKLCCIPKILKNESNSQLKANRGEILFCCVVSQRYWKMKAIHNFIIYHWFFRTVVLYPKDTEKWKQFTTSLPSLQHFPLLCCIPKILKNESNSQLGQNVKRNWKVVLYPKDTEKWKQFTTESSLI